MSGQSQRTVRIVSLVAATAVSLASGTNYAYSAWEPQLAERLKLTATEGELIGTFGNLGMYITGIPFGFLVDNRGPRSAATIGAICLAVGYFPIYQAYDRGLHSMSTSLLCFFSFLTGCGSCSSFQAALKTAALNWPQNRGTATAFPLAAFGLSAFFFSTISSIAFPNNTSDFLLLLAAGTSAIVSLSVFFLRIVHDQSAYSAVSTNEPDGIELHARSPRTPRTPKRLTFPQGPEPDLGHQASASDEDDPDDDASDLSSTAGDTIGKANVSNKKSSSRWIDVFGLALLTKSEFWQLWIQMGLLSGIGLMTINNIGNNTLALWTKFDSSASRSFITKQQALHVSTISFLSFLGRLTSGISSDYLVTRLHSSRFWCATLSGLIFTLAQLFALQTSNPLNLWIVSALSGLAYGFLFGVMPALVADAFGGGNLSVNWGFITLAPIVSGNVFNLAYGTNFDKHSVINEEGGRECEEGLGCYSSAYAVTFVASLVGIVVSLWGVRQDGNKRKRKGVALRDAHRDA